MTIKIQGTNSTAAPGITGGDTDTGVKFGTNEVTLVTNGTDRFKIGSDGAINTNMQCHGHIELDSTGAFTSPAVKLFANTGVIQVKSGGGIDFSATGDATTSGAASTSELLDDYEEGTWTATISFDTGTTGITYTSDRKEGHYVKIGKLVLAYFRVDLASKGSSTGIIRLNGLPYAVADTFTTTGHDGQLYIARSSGFNSSNVGAKPVGGYTASPNTYAVFQKRKTNGDYANLNNSDVDNDWDITGVVQYFAT